MVHLKVLELCCLKLMVHIYTTGPNDSIIYNRYIAQIGVTGVLAYGGNWPIGVLALIINSSMALVHSETLYILSNIIYCYKIKWLRNGKRWYRDNGIRNHNLY